MAPGLQQRWIGLDVGERVTALCAVDELGNVILRGECPTRVPAILGLLAPIPLEQINDIAVESGCSNYLARKLRAADLPVSIIEAGRVRRLLEIQRVKNDRNDAEGIANIARLRAKGIAVHLKNMTSQTIRSRLVLRKKLVEQRITAEISIRSLLALNGGRLPKLSRLASVRDVVEAEAARVWAEDGIDLFEEIRPLIAVADGLRDHIKAADQWAATTAGANPACLRFMTVPGVGPICSLSFFSAIENPERFARSADVGAYLGLTPKIHESGTFRRTLRISRMGNKMTRTHLVSAACVMMRVKTPSDLQRWALELAGRIGRGRARVALARKLAVVMHSMWKNETSFVAERLPATVH